MTTRTSSPTCVTCASPRTWRRTRRTAAVRSMVAPRLRRLRDQSTEAETHRGNLRVDENDRLITQTAAPRWPSSDVDLPLHGRGVQSRPHPQSGVCPGLTGRLLAHRRRRDWHATPRVFVTATSRKTLSSY